MTQPGNRLKEQRERSRLTQEEVAKLLDVSVATVSRHESSSRGLSADMIANYSALYKVPSHELFVRIEDLEEGEVPA